jgi:hypothetical protein
MPKRERGAADVGLDAAPPHGGCYEGRFSRAQLTFERDDIARAQGRSYARREGLERRQIGCVHTLD